jgi:hypothetical protein
VIETFYEPQTQPSDSIFTGSFTLDSTTNEISNLTGSDRVHDRPAHGHRPSSISSPT